MDKKEVMRKEETLTFEDINTGWRLRCVCQTYLQSDVAELTTLSQSVHFGHGGIQETFVLKDQITIWNHLGEFRVFLLRHFFSRNKITSHSCSLSNMHSAVPR